MNIKLGGYVSQETSNMGRGAVITREINIPEFMIDSPPVQSKITKEDAERALGVLFAYIYKSIRLGDYELSEGEQNIFENSVDC